MMRAKRARKVVRCQNCRGFVGADADALWKVLSISNGGVSGGESRESLPMSIWREEKLRRWAIAKSVGDY